TYAGDLALTAGDFDAGGSTPIFSQAFSPVSARGVTIAADATEAVNTLLQDEAFAIGFNLRESQNPGNALIATEWIFVSTILASRKTTQASFSQPGTNGIFGPPSLTAPGVPEPASILLLGTGLIGFGTRRWRNRRQRG